MLHELNGYGEPDDRARFDERRYRERLRAHREKTGVLNLFEEFFVSPSTAAVDIEKTDGDTEKSEKLKLASLYSDFYGSQASAPSEIITKELASGAMTLADNRVRHFTQEVRPKFDQILKIDPQKILNFENELLRSESASRLSDTET